MELCIVATNYPTPNRPALVFVENVVVNLVDRGIQCNVIAPQSSFAYFTKKNIRRDLVSERTTPGGNKYMVCSPLYTVYPMMTVGPIHFNDKSKMSYYKAIKRVYRKHNMKADLLYSHFFQAGIPAVKLAKELGIPSIIANGEAETIRETSHISRELMQKTLEDVSGIISVSSKNKGEVFELCGGKAEIMDKVIILPNAIEPTRFFKKDKTECRKKLGLPEEAFVVAFTGSFIERKGIMKLSAALDRFEDAYSMFIGSGALRPTCKNVLHIGSVRNSELCDYLNAADVFVLPTLAEGCCNAILEAMACGVPIVSSNRSFNNDILDATNAIVVDPLSEDEIYQAIKQLKESPEKRNQLSNGCLEKARDLTLERRVDKIVDFIRSKI